MQIDQQLALYPAALDEYSSGRFAYFLDRADRLERRIASETKKNLRLTESRLSEGDARKTAIDLRNDLLSRLERFAGQREAERGALATQQGVIEGDGLRTSTINLCDLAGDWLKRKDSVDVVLLKHAGLTQEKVGAARKAASAIGSTGGKAALEGAKVVRDSPLVNLDEGGLLFEMLDVSDVFDRAAARTNVVQRLVPNGSIRHVFVRPAEEVTAGDSPRDGAEPSDTRTDGLTPRRGPQRGSRAAWGPRRQPPRARR